VKTYAEGQVAAYERFLWLHQQSGAFVMPNAWDGGSAGLLGQAGFQALGSSSFALAAAIGRPDGVRALGRAESIAHAALLGAVSGLPVNGDLEDGFGMTPEACVATVGAAIAQGLAGLGIEDTTADPARPIHDFEAAVGRMSAAARAARVSCCRFGGHAV
jgi:2-methylisocitrate lyase-like PEP mutase family enzyme